MNTLLFYTLFLLTLTTISPKNDYYLSNPQYSEDGATFTATLTYSGTFNPSDYHYDWTKKDSNLLVPIQTLSLNITLECNQYLHIYITDSKNPRWENPYAISDTFKEKVKQCSTETSTKSLKDFGLFINEDTKKSFYITLTNPENNDLVFTTENTDFLFSEYFIGFAGYTTSNDIYGFGERYHELKLGDGKFTMWPNDTSGIYYDEGTGGYNAMGIHPCGFLKTKSKSFVGLLFNNINAQDIYIKTENEKNDENNVLVEHRTIGGVLDYYITLNSSPDETLISLHEILGHPILPPFWSLGFHQCRYGYKKTDEIKNVYQGYMGYELPIDTFWADIDILQDFRIFTVNMQHFSDLPNLIQTIHSNNYKFVPIVDIGFPLNDTDEFYRKGKELNAFVKSNYTNDDLISYVWPGKAVFPDFFCDEAKDLWEYGLDEYYKLIKYDGIWLDMNEPAMIYVDDINRGELLPEGYDFDVTKNKYEYIPYVPGYRVDHPTIRSRTLSENSYSKLKTENQFLDGYNFKPLMALLENKVTNEKLQKLNKRPFILSRSTSLGQGKYSFHWLGDNFADYNSMRNGVNGIFQFQIYGIPMTGDDICGFINDSNDNLCARWMSLGAFFPFSRNHNTIYTRGQEPFAWEPDSLTLPSSMLALRMRYSLLRYYYTELFKISLGESGSFFKPVFFEYFSDDNAYENVDESVLLGKNLILFPVFSDDTSNITVYLPKDDWSVYPSGEIIKNKTEESGKISLSGNYANVNIFMRGGAIIPYQETFKKFVPNTYSLNNQYTELIVIPDSENHLANGDIIIDDDDVYTLKNKTYYYVKMNFNHDTLYFNAVQEMGIDYNKNNMYLSKIKLFRMSYLTEENMVRVNFKNGRVVNVPIDIIDDDKWEVDLTGVYVRFNEVSTIRIFTN